MIHTITYEILGKKYRSRIEADTKTEAENKLRRKIWQSFQILEHSQSVDNDEVMNGLKNIFGMK